MTRPLEGIRVVEVSMYAYVPAAAAVLCDWGAEVVKIEHPEYADPMRGLKSAALAGVDTSHVSYSFTSEVVNRGKRAIAVDIATPEGHDIVMRLVDDADVFITNFLAPARARLGIDVADVQGRKPSIVYARGTGHGPRGPDADAAGFDSVSFWARAGIAVAATPASSPIPSLLPGMGFGDVLSGAVLAGGVAAALSYRDRTGVGTVVDGSLFATGLWAMQPAVTAAAAFGVDDLRLSFERSKMINPLAASFATKQGPPIALTMLDSQRYWAGMCEVMDRADLIDDPRFATADDRAANCAACMNIFEQEFAARTTDEWRERLSRQDGAWTVYAVTKDSLSDEQAWANGYLQNVPYGDDEHATLVSAPVQFDEEPPSLRPGPRHGANTDDVLAELGFDWDAIIALKAQGIVN